MDSNQFIRFLRVERVCFTCEARETVVFPRLKAGNTLRGALGDLTVSPVLDPGPSGFRQPPKPYVLRAHELDGKSFRAGQKFGFSVHKFGQIEGLEERFRALGSTGIGPGRGTFEVKNVDFSVQNLPLWGQKQARLVRLGFVSQTDLGGEPDGGLGSFGNLFARVRDRISTLMRFYQGGAPDLDYIALGKRASLVEVVSSDLTRVEVTRRSSRTGQVHQIGGWTGTVEYSGELGEFLPWLEAAWWTGVGRHTVWGNGVIEISDVE